jgi:hypothetical protein
VSHTGAAALCAALRDRAVIVHPGEVLIVQVPPDWPVQDIRDLNDALLAYTTDPDYRLDIKVLVVPGTGLAVAQPPADPFTES